MLLTLLLSATALAAPARFDAPLRPVPASARAEGAVSEGRARVRARLVIDPAGATTDSVPVGVLFDLDPGWHMYWRNSGDTGLPTRIAWKLDAGSVSALRWPAPSAYSEAEGLFVTYGYSDQVLLAATLDISQDSDEARFVEADVKVLVCETQCIPADLRLRRSVDDALVDGPDAQRTHALFTHYAARVPPPARSAGLEVEALYSRSALRPGESFKAAIAIHDCMGEGKCEPLEPPPSGVAFFQESTESVELSATGRLAPSASDDAFLLTFDGLTDDDADTRPGQRLRGVLALVDRAGEARAVEVDLPLPIVPADERTSILGEHWLPTAGLPASGGAAPAFAAAPSIGLLEAILLALLGGLILNLMPCVLPVLAIKVFAVAEMAGKSRREVLMDGFAYAVGILASMAALAAAVLALRGVGAQVGWGFQFQSPVFVAIISIVLVAFALNLFGVYEISMNVGGAANVANRAHGTRRSLFEGLLAVVLATPCSAPFLGTAVGFAFAGSPVTIVGIFLAIGFGLALPYLLITWVPAWSRFMPRSGPWMLTLRAGLGFALLATVVWLLYIAGGLSGTTGMTALLALLVGLAFTLFVFGRVQMAERRWPRLVALASVLAVIWLGLDAVQGAFALEAGEPAGKHVGASGESRGWPAWDPARISRSLAAGRPVLVVFSAEWCITCKVNERVVLRDEQIVAEFERLQVDVMKADWTRRDETIRAELARFGRAGVPMYLLYHPSRPDSPKMLPELLSVGLVIEALREPAILANLEVAS